MSSWKQTYEVMKPFIEKNLEKYMDEIAKDRFMKDVMLYSLNAGGKRLRPFLSLMTADLLCEKREKTMPYAAALEMIHTYSLIHDDLPAMDDDDLRRGKPSSHKKYGEDVAVLAGDALLTDAFSVLFVFGEGNMKRGGGYLASAAGVNGMVLGQLKDCRTPESQRDLETLDCINNLKTARLISAGLAGTAAWLDKSPDMVSLLEEFGKHLGIAFQITDDILDVTSSEEILGKPVGSDAVNEKATYPSILGIDKAHEFAEKHIESAKKVLRHFPESSCRDDFYGFTDYILTREK
ncbi:MAG: polyprenyl synthetase family protein [bacterium]